MDIVNYYIKSSVSLEECYYSSNDLINNLREKFPLLNIIKTVCTTQISQIRLQNKELLVDLFSKNLRRFMSREKVIEILDSTKLTDDDIVVYSKFREAIKQIIRHSVSSSSSRSPERSPVNIHRTTWVSRKGRESRESARQQDIFRFYNGKPQKYLDLGGGDGKITSAIGQHLRLSKDNIVCADIESWWDNDRKEEEDITYMKLSEGEKLPFKDGEFSLITCFQSLHHMKNIDKVMSELYRILEYGGYIIIREHDCDNALMKLLIDIEHCIFETILKDLSKDFILNYHGDYKSKIEWSNLFAKHKLYFCNRRYNFKTARNNPTRYYYSMYYKH